MQAQPFRVREAAASLPPSDSEAAFSLRELVAVLAALALLAVLALPLLAGGRLETKRAQCTENLRRLTLAIHLYSSDNNDRLPSMQGGSWAWDVPTTVTTALSKVGVIRDQFYCPANLDQVDLLWNFTPGYRVIGYVLAFTGNAGLIVTNANPTLVPQQIISAGTVSPAPIASQRALTADATISSPGQNNPANVAGYNFTSIQGGAPMPHHTSHLIDKLPAGGNLGMLDGHVEWREFSKMLPRSSSGPVFWW